MNFETGIYNGLWYCFATAAVVTGAYVVLARNIVRAAFALVFTFFAVAALYIFLGADFLAAAQLLIYGGGITVLLLFGVMLTHRVEGMELQLEPMKAVPAAIVSGFFLWLLVSIARRTTWPVGDSGEMEATTAAIGEAIMTTHLLPFELLSVLLLVILVGAMYLARRDRAGGGEEAS